MSWFVVEGRATVEGLRSRVYRLVFISMRLYLFHHLALECYMYLAATPLEEESSVRNKKVYFIFQSVHKIAVHGQERLL